ncbi:MinD/ParA family ATP-binding protein [Paractinoplanes maris]|uniref:MinD/ParA family ATP-binding protein n=1 Tax=Paractinoplanes maris TaxID=1734446 RepID=UPI0020225E74|nr:chromosome partitioning protein [Actinoplanes maris]
MEDESADRVYVPGAAGNPAPPDRDVEPFWAPEELEAPVHGRPVPHEAPPPIQLPQTPPPPNGAPGIYRPGERIPVPPPVTVPVPPPAHVPVPPRQGPPPTQAWPNLEPQAPVPDEPASAAPVSGGEESGVHSSPDSPWSQPPQRPAPAAEPPAPAPPRATATAAVPVAPAQPPVSRADPGQPDDSAIYRPAAPAPPAHGAAAVPPPQPGPQPQTHAPQPHPPAQPAPRQPPGPYPPTMDPRAMPPQAAVPHPPPPAMPPAMPPQAAVPHPQPPAPAPPSTDPFQDLPWVSDGTPTAEEFARRRMAKPADPVATQGARAILRKGTMGLVKLAPGKREQEYKQDVEMVRRNFGGLRQVTVVNPKGGAGKTVAVLLLAMTFGQKRGGYVLAWDNNETQGTLGMRAQQDFHARTVRDMMRDLHLFRGSHGRVGDLSQYVRAQGEGMFDVLASDESATAGEMLTADAFGEIREIVSRFYKLIFVDTGNNVRAQNWQAAMDATDQLVITMSARNDSAETAARMLDHLEQSGRQRLVRQAVSVVSMPPTRKDIDLPAIQRHFAARTRAVLLAPYEKLIDSGEPIRYGHLSSSTRDAWLKIAAAVAEGL